MLQATAASAVMLSQGAAWANAAEFLYQMAALK
jgi:hypothetical protein